MPTCHCGTCSSSAARLASHTSVGRSSTSTKSTVSRFFDDPGTGSRTVCTQDGTPRGAFFSKKPWASTPSGYRILVTGRPVRCGSSTGAIRV